MQIYLAIIFPANFNDTVKLADLKNHGASI